MSRAQTFIVDSLAALVIIFAWTTWGDSHENICGLLTGLTVAALVEYVAWQYRQSMLYCPARVKS